jgi:hypothetical protein
MNQYDKKMLIIYIRKVKEKLRIVKWNLWQKINRNLLKTYPLIEDCARCEECGRNVHDYHVPDDLWIKVYGDESGVLCYDCFCNKLDEMGLWKRTEINFKWY